MNNIQLSYTVIKSIFISHIEACASFILANNLQTIDGFYSYLPPEKCDDEEKRLIDFSTRAVRDIEDKQSLLNNITPDEFDYAWKTNVVEEKPYSENVIALLEWIYWERGCDAIHEFLNKKRETINKLKTESELIEYAKHHYSALSAEGSINSLDKVWNYVFVQYPSYAKYLKLADADKIKDGAWLPSDDQAKFNKALNYAITKLARFHHVAKPFSDFEEIRTLESAFSRSFNEAEAMLEDEFFNKAIDYAEL